MKHIVRAGLFFAFLFIHHDAAAVCGDVNGDGNPSATDALAVLRAATGQPVELVCAGEGPSSLRFFNDFFCGPDPSSSEASFNGFDFAALSNQFSPYETVDRETIETITVTICGGEYTFSGPIFLPPDRKISFFVALLDPEVYDPGSALFVLYDDGEAASALSAGADAMPATPMGYGFGSRVTR